MTFILELNEEKLHGNADEGSFYRDCGADLQRMEKKFRLLWLGNYQKKTTPKSQALQSYELNVQCMRMESSVIWYNISDSSTRMTLDKRH